MCSVQKGFPTVLGLQLEDTVREGVPSAPDRSMALRVVQRSKWTSLLETWTLSPSYSVQRNPAEAPTHSDSVKQTPSRRSFHDSLRSSYHGDCGSNSSVEVQT